LKGAGPVIIQQEQHQEETSPYCQLPMLVGRCKAAFPRWFYDSNTNTCKQFVFGGCGGNMNNFERKQDCEESCLVKTNTVKRAPIPIVEITRTDDDICSLPSVTGPCRAMFHRYYHNVNTGHCEIFTYGGCAGNQNNFESIEECESKCKKAPTPTTTTEEISTTTEQTLVIEVENIQVTDPNTEHASYLKQRMQEDTWYSNQVSKEIASWGEQNADILKNWQQSNEQKAHKDTLQKDFNLRIQRLKQVHDDNLNKIKQKHEAKMVAFIKNDLDKSYETFNQQISVEEPDSDMVLQSLELYLTSEKKDQDYVINNFQIAFDDGEISDEKAKELKVKLQEKLNKIQERALETIALLNQHPQMKMEIQETIDQMLSSILPSEVLQIPTDDNENETIDEGGLPASKVSDNKPQSLPIAGGQPMNIAAASAWDGIVNDIDNSGEGVFLRYLSITCGCVALVVIMAALARYYQANKIHHSQFTKIQVDDHLTIEEKQLLQMQQNGYENPTYKFFEKQHPQA